MPSNLKSATLARCAPLSSEDRVDRLAAPLALAPLVLDEVRLLTHAEPLEHAHRPRVARLDAAVDAVQAVRVERELDDRLGRLGRVAVTLVVGVEHEADLALAVLTDGDVRGADQLAFEIDRQHDAFVERPRDVGVDRGAHLVLAAWVPEEPARDVLARVDGLQRGEVT